MQCDLRGKVRKEMKKIFKQFIAMLLVVVLQLNAVCYINAADFPESDTIQNLDEQDVSLTGTDSFGNMLAEQANAQMKQQQGNNNISGLKFSGNTATVEFTARQDAELVVAVYDENDRTKMLTAGKMDIAAGATSASIILNQDEMPQYFIAKAFMLERESHKPLCNAYTTELYMKVICDLRESTVDDYDEEKVVQFDGNNRDTDFAVLNEKTVSVEEDENKNRLKDNGDGSYTITNADSTFTKLKEGDTFSYKCQNGDLILVKIANSVINGETVIIYEDPNTDLRDYFDYIKIEADSSQGECSVDNSHLKKGVTPLDKGESAEFSAQAIEGDVSGGVDFSYNIDIEVSGPIRDSKVIISGVVDLGFLATIDYYLALKYQYFSAQFDVSLNGTYSMSGEIEKKEITLGEFSVQPLPCINIGFEPDVVVSASAKMTATIGIKGTIGSAYDSDSGFEDLSFGLDPEYKFEIEGKIFVGIKASPVISIINKKLCKGKVSFLTGMEFVATRASYVYGEEDQIHECNTCFSGVVNRKTEVEISLDIMKDLKNLKKTFDLGVCKIADFYYSEDYHEFGYNTTCPHIRYPVEVVVKGKQDQLIENAMITVTDEKTGLPVDVYTLNERKNQLTLIKMDLPRYTCQMAVIV